MNIKHFTPLVCAFFLIQATPTLSHANELGSYSWQDTFKHYFSPVKADNPVKDSDQALSPLEIKPTTTGYKDGFNPSLYDIWQKVTLDPTTGASCGDGTPYTFFVKRKANTSNLTLTFEGGGACWDYDSCSRDLISTGIKNIFTGNKDRSSILVSTGFKNNSPLSSLLLVFGSAINRDFDPWLKNRTQKWTKVYMPYCTGDVFIGTKTKVYTDPDSDKKLVVHHKGAVNILQTTAWIKDNLEQPKQMMSTGYSAGGIASMALYYVVRTLINPEQSYLINDAGPAWYADQNGDPETNPSKYLHDLALKQWGTTTPRLLNDGTEGSILDWMAARMTGFNTRNLGTINNAIAHALPNDRLGFTTFQEDEIFSSYSYRKFFPNVSHPNREVANKELYRYWQNDVNTFAENVVGPNYGYYLPATRKLIAGHVVLAIPDKSADIQEQGLSVSDFVNNITDGEGAVMKAKEEDFEADRKQVELDLGLIQWFLRGLGF